MPDIKSLRGVVAELENESRSACARAGTDYDSERAQAQLPTPVSLYRPIATSDAVWTGVHQGEHTFEFSSYSANDRLYDDLPEKMRAVMTREEFHREKTSHVHAETVPVTVPVSPPEETRHDTKRALCQQINEHGNYYLRLAYGTPTPREAYRTFWGAMLKRSGAPRDQLTEDQLRDQLTYITSLITSHTGAP